MSNGDDVLDNWEEIDEAGLNNTLQKIDAIRKTHNDTNAISSSTSNITKCVNEAEIDSASELLKGELSKSEFPPMKVLQRSPNATSPATGSMKSGTSVTTSPSSADGSKSSLDNMAATFHPVLMVLHKPADDYESANYTPAINSQTVKILRRPTQSNEGRNDGVKPKQPIKTLQQREQEYAEARLRIMGAAKNPEDDLAATPNNNTSVGGVATTIGSVATAANNTATTSTVITNQARVKPGVSATHVYNSQQYHQQQHQQQQQNYYFQQQQISQPAYNNRSSGAPALLGHHPSQLVAHHHNSGPALLGPCPPGSVMWSPTPMGNVTSRKQPQQQQHSPHNTPESVLRSPRGPDGSTGFQIRR